MKLISEEIIKPSIPTADAIKEQKLSYIDQLIHSVYIPVIFFYNNNNNPLSSSSSSFLDNPSEKSLQLKQSLSKTLTKFYTFAGRVHRNTKILCNDSGVLFIEARVHGSLSEVLRNGAVSTDLNQFLGIEPYSGSDNDERRKIPLIVKLCCFDCGGISVGVCVFHQLADVSLLIDFMNVWAGIQRGETQIPNPRLDLGFNYFPPLNQDDVIQPPVGPPPEERIVMRKFVFDKEKITEIKEQISSNLQNPTRIEAVSAFIWKHIIQVIKAKDESKTIFTFILAVNLRPKIFPNQPDSIIGGNFSVGIEGICRSEEDTNIQGIAKVARNCKEKFDYELVKKTQNGSVYYDNLRHESLEFFMRSDSIFGFITSWCNFPLYKVDYGWGKPVSVAPVLMSYKNMVFLLDTKSGDGIQAWITMAEDEMAMLPPELLSLENNDL